MRYILKKITFYIIKYFYILYSYERHIHLKNYINQFYSYWIRNSFGYSGKSICLKSPTFIKGGKYISIGDNFNSCEGLRLECWDTFEGVKFSPELKIGNNVSMNYIVHIGCIDQISIGDNVLFASNIFITDHYHGYIDERDIGIAPVKRNLSSKGPVIIESNVWIGENVTILPNVIIGENSIIGANSVVNKNVPANSVAAGNPVKVIKTLYKKYHE